MIDPADLQLEFPVELHGSAIVLYAKLDHRCRWTGNCQHYRDEQLLAPSSYLAICEQNGIFYLFGCDAAWEPLSETSHTSLGEAQHQAEYEYQGVSQCWEKIPPWAKGIQLHGFPAAQS